MIALIVVLAVAAVVLGAWAASTTLESRSGSNRSFRAMDDYEIADVRDEQMKESIGARVLAPVSRGLLDLARRFTPVGYTEDGEAQDRARREPSGLRGRPLPDPQGARFRVRHLVDPAGRVTFLSGHTLFAILVVGIRMGRVLLRPRHHPRRSHHEAA